ncbi:E3 ubiquitin-protein ligase ATL59-like protein [Cinnamomum micranthum f. kanehirae]|uniref:E3 ubiquitin-protein ligase ATL59-like protein n=1 Tax=Cinnamomum micranthum f. kanehirae TaxID=337451 RepID=A0A3S3N0H7_9MAGN|nr:E3 ubiquitin-protein ligase ATL59-like protein [Cinnamomum micranthum f. kanehirae]
MELARLSNVLYKVCKITFIFFLLLLNEAVVKINAVIGLIGLKRNSPNEIALDRYMALVENQLPLNRFGNGSKWESMECAVCLHEFKEGEEMTELKCKHAFHKDCLNRWLQHNERALYPLCRSPVLSEEVMLEFWRREKDYYSEEQLLDWHFSFHTRNSDLD